MVFWSLHFDRGGSSPDTCLKHVRASVGILGRCAYRAALVFACCVSFSRAASAAPETWFAPTTTYEGNAASGFGSAVACGQGFGFSNSMIAVGAPLEDNGDGRVYLYSGAGRVQTLYPPSPGGSRNFGYAVTFTNYDINGDSIAELLVGEPDTNGTGGGGRVHLYLSNEPILPSPPPAYGPCHSLLGDKSFGSTIATTPAIISGGVEFVVGIPEMRSITGHVADSACSSYPVASYDSMLGMIGSRYGQGISMFFYPDDLNARLLVTAPRISNDNGGIFMKPFAGGAATVIYPGTNSERFGVAVASRYWDTIFAFNAPYASVDPKTVYLKRIADGFMMDGCSLTIPMADLPYTASQSLAHLGTLLNNFTGSGSGWRSFASYRSEATTGGSVALFGSTNGSTCSDIKKINNCVQDAGQKQGYAITGGPECEFPGGKQVLVVGAPGYDNNKGRVDIYEAGTQFASVRQCGEATATPSPTPTPVASATPTSGGFSGPIPVDPKTRGLPAPDVMQVSRSITVTAPALVSSTNSLKLIGYSFLVVRNREFSAKSMSLNLYQVNAKSQPSGKRRQMFSKRNSVTLRNLGSGTYTASYRPVFVQTKNPRRQILGIASQTRTFTVR